GPAKQAVTHRARDISIRRDLRFDYHLPSFREGRRIRRSRRITDVPRALGFLPTALISKKSTPSKWRSFDRSNAGLFDIVNRMNCAQREPHTRRHRPARPGDPVITAASVITGCPAFAGHDG